MAHDNGVPLIVDNTVATPWLIRPFECGADIVVHSATKFIGGHGTSIGGVIVDGGTLRLRRQRHASRSSPSPTPATTASQYWPALGPGAYILKARVQLLRDIGAAITPVQRLPAPPGPRDAEPAHGAPQRQRRQGGRVPRRPRRRSSRCSSPGCPTRPGTTGPRSTAGGRGFGSVPAFIIEGGKEAGQRFVEAPRRCTATWPTSATCAAWPSTRRRPPTRQLTEEEQVSTGVDPGPRAPLGRPRVDRRHPRRPRAGLRRRQGLIPSRRPSAPCRPSSRRVSPARGGVPARSRGRAPRRSPAG